MIESLAELRAFARVVETGGFSAAARSLSMSTAMVSRHVTALENRLGVRLLDRNTRRSAPTAAGLRFHERCVELLTGLDEAAAEIADAARDARGRLRVAMPGEFAIPHLAPLLPALRRRHPQLELQLVLSTRVLDLVEEGLDLALRFMREYDAALPGRRLARTTMCLAASPAYLRAHGRPARPGDLAGHAGICYGGPEPWTRFPWQRGAERGTLQLVPTLVASSSQMVCQAAVQGLGVAVVATLDAGGPLRRGELVRLLPEHDLGALDVFAVMPHRRHPSVKVRAFVDFLAEALGGDASRDPFVEGLRVPA